VQDKKSKSKRNIACCNTCPSYLGTVRDAAHPEYTTAPALKTGAYKVSTAWISTVPFNHRCHHHLHPTHSPAMWLASGHFPHTRSEHARIVPKPVLFLRCFCNRSVHKQDTPYDRCRCWKRGLLKCGETQFTCADCASVVQRQWICGYVDGLWVFACGVCKVCFCTKEWSRLALDNLNAVTAGWDEVNNALQHQRVIELQ